MLPRRHSGIPAYLIQDQLTGDSAMARTPKIDWQSLTVNAKRP
jgi:hypothetical protein